MSLLWAALGAGNEGDVVEVVLEVDGAPETRKATLQFQGALGQVPIVEFALDDSLIARLSAGKKLAVRTVEGASEVALTGSRRALDILVAACR
jgi:invasion protein IalB